MKKQTWVLVSIVLITTLGLTYFITEKNTPSAIKQPTYQQITTRPEFSLPDIDGNVRSIKEWDGKYIVLNFWATWCPPCQKEIPDFIEMQKKYHANNLQFVGVAIDDEEIVRRFTLEKGINYPSLIAEVAGIDIAKQYGNRTGALPFSVIIDPSGQVVFQHAGILSEKKILSFTNFEGH